MERNGQLPMVSDLILAYPPTNLAAAANAGKWLNICNCEGFHLLFITGIGASGEDPVITLEQAQDSSGTGAKELKLREVWYKLGATGIGAAQDKWTKVAAIDRDNPAASYTHTDGAENDFVVYAYVIQQDLDVNNGFKYIRQKIADVGATAQYGLMLALPAGRNYMGIPNFSMLA